MRCLIGRDVECVYDDDVSFYYTLCTGISRYSSIEFIYNFVYYMFVGMIRNGHDMSTCWSNKHSERN